MRHDYNTSATRLRHELHKYEKSDTSKTRAIRVRQKSNTSATQKKVILWMEGCVRSKVKLIVLVLKKIGNITFFIILLFYQIVCYNQEIYSLSGHFPKIHRSALCQITIDLLYFWDVYDINLREKKFGRSTAYSCRTNALYNFIVLRKNNRYSWRLNKSSKTF